MLDFFTIGALSRGFFAGGSLFCSFLAADKLRFFGLKGKVAFSIFIRALKSAVHMLRSRFDRLEPLLSENETTEKINKFQIGFENILNCFTGFTVVTLIFLPVVSDFDVLDLELDLDRVIRLVSASLLPRLLLVPLIFPFS